MENEFFGREAILGDLSALWKKRVPSFVTCRGRRRIGKTTLIERFARISGAKIVKIEGLRPKTGLTNDDELAHFASQLRAQTGADGSKPTDWLSAFIRLDRELASPGRTVVLLDEISWMAHYDPTFTGTLKIAWDNYFKKHPRLVFFVCGSVSSWIADNIIGDGSFYGRRSIDVVVPELPLDQCVRFWGKAAGRIAPAEILDVLSVTGGIPRYLEEIDPSLTADENVRRLCFRPKSVLRDDFDEMFADVITKAPTFANQVLRKLTSAPRTAAEISEALGIVKNGHVSSALSQLEEAGMVCADSGKNPLTGSDMRERRYRLSDNYIRFYFKYIEPAKAVIDRGAYSFGTLEALEGWSAIKGLAFENLVVNNAASLVKKLGFGASLITSMAPYRRAGRCKGDGVQIDLLVQTRRSVCVVEIKRQREIDRSVIDEVAAKVAKLPKRPGVSVRTALVYEGHLAPIVEADGYFDSIVPFRTLLGL